MTTVRNISPHNIEKELTDVGLTVGPGETAEVSGELAAALVKQGLDVNGAGTPEWELVTEVTEEDLPVADEPTGKKGRA